MIATLAMFSCTSGTSVPNIETHLRDVPIEKRAVSSSKYNQDFVLCVHMLLLNTIIH